MGNDAAWETGCRRGRRHRLHGVGRRPFGAEVARLPRRRRDHARVHAAGPCDGRSRQLPNVRVVRGGRVNALAADGNQTAVLERERVTIHHQRARQLTLRTVGARSLALRGSIVVTTTASGRLNVSAGPAPAQLAASVGHASARRPSVWDRSRLDAERRLRDRHHQRPHGIARVDACAAARSDRVDRRRLRLHHRQPRDGGARADGSRRSGRRPLKMDAVPRRATARHRATKGGEPPVFQGCPLD